MNTAVPEQILEGLLPEPSLYPETGPIHFMAMQKAGVVIVEEDDSFSTDPLQYMYCHVIFKSEAKDVLAQVKLGRDSLKAWLDEGILKITFEENNTLIDNIRKQIVKTFAPSLPFDAGTSVKKNTAT
jgi:hypothetical protein